ncbi:predicted protein [Sclerotinia sclerotiorum 1980 UF-70]|uniref:Uncharacterized protein n=1 Tax=Sclerotinia sclerotiorum (strain ATCC 18683 / 1980 / Ss-1) TaxID=665079 RepID=A7EBV8_SCLS1|nr:predicted protein [Sclerotinia sclerotiorum 1980 UF-70]EDN99936.1 predicted protein [Sclerotinia sclerotiorum 1980 UF-70]
MAATRKLCQVADLLVTRTLATSFDRHSCGDHVVVTKSNEAGLRHCLTWFDVPALLCSSGI